MGVNAFIVVSYDIRREPVRFGAALGAVSPVIEIFHPLDRHPDTDKQ